MTNVVQIDSICSMQESLPLFSESIFADGSVTSKSPAIKDKANNIPESLGRGNLSSAVQKKSAGQARMTQIREPNRYSSIGYIQAHNEAQNSLSINSGIHSGIGSSIDRSTDLLESNIKQDHLASAKRLSRAMRKIPSHSKQHIVAGRLLCHHLVEMLHDSPAHNLRPVKQLK